MDNNYIVLNNNINESDMVIINNLFKYKTSNLNKIIKKLDNYHINYKYNNKIKEFNDNKYFYYKDKFTKQIQIKEEIDYICKYLETNILKRNIKYLLKEIENIIDG